MSSTIHTVPRSSKTKAHRLVLQESDGKRYRSCIFPKQASIQLIIRWLQEGTATGKEL